MILLFHRGGHKACNKPALYLKKEQASQYDFPADNVVKLDGTAPTRGEYAFCGSCGEPLHFQLLAR